MADSIEETDVAVVGAGGGGAVLALALAKQGVSTVVLDQAAGPPKGLRGEILQPNGQQVLDRWGVLPSLPADATRSVLRLPPGFSPIYVRMRNLHIRCLREENGDG